MNSYKVLNKQIFTNGNYSIVPIRFEDRLNIMQWRNEQIYHLRQSKPLTEEDQNHYFETVVSKLFDQENPSQILFSYLEEDKCIGYGGLVHINWSDRNAEISFIMNTQLEEQYFEKHWSIYLGLIEKVAFAGLNFHKIFTYAFDLRPRLYNALLDSGFQQEATLKEHCFIDGKFLDVLYHSKINSLILRKATLDDVGITFKWANDPEIRKFSFTQNEIKKNEHAEWFSNKINSSDCHYFILENCLCMPLGSVRLDVNEGVAVISYLIDSSYFGRGLGTQILHLIEQKIKIEKLPIFKLVGHVKNENLASVKIFKNLGYNFIAEGEDLKFFKELS
jgi:RimJ/RimL family protein N-acetyltransferase